MYIETDYLILCLVAVNDEIERELKIDQYMF